MGLKYLGIKITDNGYQFSPKPYIDIKGYLSTDGLYDKKKIVKLEIEGKDISLTLEQFTEFMETANEILSRLDVDKMEKIL